MPQTLALARQQANHTRYAPGQAAGHYESFFQRANDPARARAFWIRYTIFSPDQHPEDALGELWAVYFDGETSDHVAVRQQFPFRECTFKQTAFGVQIGAASLAPGKLSGASSFAGHTISWNLSFSGGSDPLFLLPLPLYPAKFPQAKSLVGLPLATYNGTLNIDGRMIEVADWVGSQNHNWGAKHTDFYAWGQVAGFEGRPDTFLEVATARLKLGPLWTPFITPLVLRHQGEEIALNRIVQTVRARATIDGFHWSFKSEDARVRVEGQLSAPREAFVGLRYANPPGGSKFCLNSKIASARLTITRKPPHQPATVETLLCKNRAAFEILTDNAVSGIRIYTDEGTA